MLDIKKIIENKELFSNGLANRGYDAVSYTHLRAHETSLHLV